MSVDADLVFLPWLQRGAGAATGEVESLQPDPDGVATVDATLRINDDPGNDVTMQLRVMGPGHVTALQTAQVIRTEPTRGNRAFESNYFPLIEFDEPSLPWMFTPLRANQKGQLRPWLCLVVVRKQEGVTLGPPENGSLPVLRVASPAMPFEELPDLQDSWAWAHAQVTAPRDIDADGLAGLVADPVMSLSRLVCGRVLKPDTDYLACVVPTFELGRRAGLGEPIEAEHEKRLDPAWQHSEDVDLVELPVYYSWSFATGSGGDFESLALLLKARPLPEGVGVRPFDISRSGLALGASGPTVLPLGGALRPVDQPASEWPVEALHERFRARLAEVVNLPLSSPGEQPMLAPPRYGAVQSGLSDVVPARRDRWYEQLNLEPAPRVAAQFGTQVVQHAQELLMASAWDQAAGLAEVNRLLRHAQLRLVVAASLHERHVVPLKDHPDAALRVLAPALDRVTRALEAHRPDGGLVTLMQGTGLPPAAFGATLHRMARPQGALTRRVRRPVLGGVGGVGGAGGGGLLVPRRRPSTVLTKLQPHMRVLRVISRPGPVTGPITIEKVAATLVPPRGLRWSQGNATAVGQAPPRPLFQVQPFFWPREPRDPGIDIGGPTHGGDPPVVLGDPSGPLGPLHTGGPVSPLGPVHPAGPVGPVGPVHPGGTHAGDPGGPVGPLDPGGTHPGGPDDPVIGTDPRDSRSARAFREAATVHLDAFFPFEPLQPTRRTDFTAIELVVAEALVLTVPGPALHAGIRALVDLKGQDRPDEQLLEPVTLAPVFPQPMWAPLSELGQDLMLPGMEGIPANAVVPLVTNSPFVEAYLVGLNAELGRELLWREFPAPPLSTYFRQFWDTSVAPGQDPDIPVLKDWGDRALGGTAAQGEERFVMLLRSELLRRYPHAIIYAVDPATDPPTESYPTFTGAMEPDVRFFGFELTAEQMRKRSLVIQEQPSAPRFGIEVADDPGDSSHVAVTAPHSAAVAKRLRQLPVRLTIPATVLLGKD